MAGKLSVELIRLGTIERDNVNIVVQVLGSIPNVMSNVVHPDYAVSTYVLGTKEEKRRVKVSEYKMPSERWGEFRRREKDWGMLGFVQKVRDVALLAEGDRVVMQSTELTPSGRLVDLLGCRRSMFPVSRLREFNYDTRANVVVERGKRGLRRIIGDRMRDIIKEFPGFLNYLNQGTEEAGVLRAREGAIHITG